MLFSTVMIGNVCNYIFQFALGRYLTTEEFGMMNSLVSLFVIASVPGGAIQLTVTKRLSHCRALKQDGEFHEFFNFILKYTLIISIVFFIVGFIIRNFVLNYLSISDKGSYYIILFSISLTLILPIFLGVLQGSQNFIQFGLFNAGQALIKLMVAIIAIILGLRVRWIMSSFLFSVLIVLAILVLKNRHLIKINNNESKQSLVDRNDLKFITVSFIATICITILTNIDMIFVKHYFNGHESGIYATSSMFGKMILYFPGALVLAMFPMVSESNSLNDGNNNSIFNKSLIYTLVLCGIGAFILYMQPSLFIKILFGQKYLEATTLIKFVGIAMLPLALLNITINYCLATNRRKFVYGLIVGCIVEILLINVFHSNMMQVLQIIFVTGLLIFIYSLICCYKVKT